MKTKSYKKWIPVFQCLDLLKFCGRMLYSRKFRNFFVTLLSAFVPSFLVLWMKYEQNHSKFIVMKAFMCIILLPIKAIWL